MPHIIVKLITGKSEDQKQRLAAAITRDVAGILGYGDDAVSVGFEEVAAKDWRASVYEPDILAKPGAIYKKPGYRI
jgi:4-oxalocrotonate tautomerase